MFAFPGRLEESGSEKHARAGWICENLRNVRHAHDRVKIDIDTWAFRLKVKGE